MNFRYPVLVFIFGVATLSGCASLSKSQMISVQKFSNSCDSFVKYPSALFVEMAEIRAERGCFYTASLSDPLLRIKELNSMSKAYKTDLALAKKMNISLEILKTYQRALKSLSHADRYNNTGREFRSLGRNLDSLINRYNLMDFSDPLPMGIGKAVGKIAGYGAELYVRNVQTRAVREFVIEGDSLVGAVTNSIVGILSSQSVKGLIENETKGLEANYLSLLKSGKGDFSGDREYLLLLGRTDNLSKIRSGTVSAAKALAKAHNKIASEVVKRKKLKQLYPEIEELNDELSALRRSAEKLRIY
ncbi:MAG: hypothetical protein WCX48_03480 [Bacteroidales bacterium]